MNQLIVRRVIVSSGLLFFEVLALCFPALINGSPLIFADTRSYYMGGRAAIDKIAGLFVHQSAATEDAVQKARGVRSAFYSLFTYLSTDLVSLWLVIVLQAVVVAVLLRLTFDLYYSAARPRWQATLLIICVAFLTTVAWTTSMVMPDIFTATMALSIILIVVYWSALTRFQLGGLLLCITSGVIMHVTNLPIALGVLIIGMILRFRHGWISTIKAGGLIAMALGIGFAAMLMVGIVGFHQWSINPQSPPFLLARSIADGPGRLYLQSQCPQIGLTMCQHLDRLNVSSDEFIWGQKGVYSVVSDAERTQLRAEDKPIYVAAALAHPWLQAKAMIVNWTKQLVLFGLNDFNIPSSASYTSTDMTLTGEMTTHEVKLWQIINSVPIYLIVVASLVYGMRTIRMRVLDREQRDFYLLTIAVVLVEALAGMFSEPDSRYEARVIWLIPLAAGLMLIMNCFIISTEDSA